MRQVTLAVALVCALASLLCGSAWGRTYLYDFGTGKSPVQGGFTGITPKSLYGTESAGWKETGTLQARDQAYEAWVDSSRGKVPPPVWTCPLSQDVIFGDKPAEFIAKVEPGTYQVWVICGTSARFSNTYFDFDITSGPVTRRVQLEGSYQYRQVQFEVQTAGEVRLVFSPRSLFVVAGVALWQEGDDAQFRREIMAPLRTIMDFMPPEEAAKWPLEPQVDSTPWPQTSAADQKRGYVIHQRHWAEVVYPHTVPRAADLNPELRAFATLGEYEPLNFIVYPFQPLSGAQVTVSDLRGARGSIAGGQIEVRRVRYMNARPNYTVVNRRRIVPDPLMPLDPTEPLPAEENTRYWITVHVPQSTPPGEYRGEVTFRPTGAAAARLPIRFRVLPIRLQEDPSKIYGIYYYDPLTNAARATEEVSKTYFRQKALYELDDLLAHGTRNVTVYVNPGVEKAGQPGQFEFDFDTLAQRMELWQKYRLQGPVVLYCGTSAIFRKHMGKDLGSHASGAGQPPPAYAEEITRMALAMEAERKRRGWPEFLYYPIDEPSTDPGTVAMMVETLKGLKAAGVRTYVTADPTNEGFEPMRPYVDVWCTQPFMPPREELLADRAKRPVDYWCYPNHVNGENDHTTVNGARMTYGFGFWRSGFTALIPWIYRSDSGNPWNYLDGSSSDFFNRKDDQGRPIPVAMWEAYREGYDDYRYVYTLQQLIAASTRQGGKPAELARQAQAELDGIWKAIRVQSKYKDVNLWEPRELDVYRWLVARWILRLQAAK